MKALSCNLYNLSITKRNENIIISGNDLDKDRVSQPYTFESLPDRLILFPKRGFISIDALYWLLNQKRSIIALNYRGELVGDFHPVSGTYKDSETLKKQYNLSNNVKKYLSVSLIETKSNNQLKMIDHLESVNKVDLSGFKEKIYGYKTALNTEQLPANYGTTILKTEAHITKQYWKAIRLCLPKWVEFSARGRGRNVNRKPQFATDHFNCLLNYSYSLLLSEVNRACSLNGFDPNFGFYHKNRTGLKAFSYDVIEPFRVIAEQAVLNSLKGKNRITKKDFVTIRGIYYLRPDGSKKIIERYYSEVSKRITYRGKPRTGIRIIGMKLKELSRFIAGESTAFSWEWGWV